VIHAASVQALVSSVTEALARETDSDAATEMVMAVAGDAESEAVVLEAARRLGIARIAAPALAAGAGLRALEHLDRLRELDSDLPLTSFLRIASRDRLEALGPRVARALRERDPALWKAYLEAARKSNQEVSGGLLSVGITIEALKSATLFHALASGARVAVPPESVLDGEETFLVELLARREGRKPHESKAWIASRAAGEETPLNDTREPRFDKVLLLLTKNERRALSSQIRRDPESLDVWYERAKKAEGEVVQTEGPIARTAAMRTVSDFPDGFVASILDVTGCAPEAVIGIEAAEVDYSLAGRPERVLFNPFPFEVQSCSAASRALVLTSVVPPHSLSAKEDWSTLLVLLEPGFLSCLSEPRPRSWIDGRAGAHAGDAIKQLNKVREMAPVYPPTSLAAGIQGDVVLDAMVTTSGCVRAIQTLRSPDSRLALASVVAVSGWRYEPPRLEGKPVPMVMEFTVSFRLK
jgi:TonB family protein